MKCIEQLQEYFKQNKMNTKGNLCLGLVVTRHARNMGLPLEPTELLTEGEGQVLGLGKSAVQNILKDYSITRTLAEEGGRTNRGSIGNMKSYVGFLNDNHNEEEFNVEHIESWWVERVQDFFAGKPFTLKNDTSKSLQATFRDLITQAEKRKSQSTGANYLGTMLQHLVGAKLNLLLNAFIKHHGASVADSPSKRDGDFDIENVSIHVTTFPSEALIRKCQENIEKGLRPIIITLRKRLSMAENLAEKENLEDRIDVFDIEQFIGSNIYELGKFSPIGRQETIENLISQYNSIIDECETDPSLKIEIP